MKTKIRLVYDTPGGVSEPKNVCETWTSFMQDDKLVGQVQIGDCLHPVIIKFENGEMWRGTLSELQKALTLKN